MKDGFDEHDADAVFLDVQNPWDFIGVAHRTLAWGCHLGILVPTFNQIEKTLDALREHGFVDVQVLELLMRYYKTDPRRIRPDDTMTAHTGFLIFAAKARPLPERGDQVETPELQESAEAKDLSCGVENGDCLSLHAFA
jgi:tRNA (adenine57-N1/adenine58-N1)-methyltransferase